MSLISKTYTFVNGSTADATQVNKNFDDIINVCNGNLDDDNIKDYTIDDTQNIGGDKGSLNSLLNTIGNVLKKITNKPNWYDEPSLSLEDVYPVGSVYINASDSTNPATLLGFGTWERFGQGKVLVSQDPNDTDFDTAGETGGEKAHTLTIDEIPSHNHTTAIYNDGASGSQVDGTIYRNDTGKTNWPSSYTGGGQAHNNLQPYIVVYMWKRTA